MGRKAGLGDADAMFMRFFNRWYGKSERTLKVFKATRPDMLTDASLIGLMVRDVYRIDEETAAEALRRVKVMEDAAIQDWGKLLDLKLPIAVQWVDAFDRYYDQARVEQLAHDSDPKDFANDYLVTVCEFGSVMGSVMIGLLPRLQWLPSWPYWESAIFDSRTGTIVPVFHWAIKKFSTYGIDDGFAAKLQVCVLRLKENAKGTRSKRHSDGR